MRIQFPVEVEQIDQYTVEVQTSRLGQPLMELKFHPAIEEALGDAKIEALYEETRQKAIQQSVKVIR